MARFIPHIVVWAILASVVAFLALYRRRIRMSSDELLHVLDTDASQVPAQNAVARKLDRIDRWGKWLTVLAALYAVAIAALYLYSAMWDNSIKLN
jgi:hypothetical protein